MIEIRIPIVAQIEDAVKDIPGWTPIDQLLTLFTLSCASAHLGGDILELGSWCGRSAVVLGMAARHTGATHVHCVDLFPEQNDWYENADGTFSFAVDVAGRKVGAYGVQTVWAEPYRTAIVPVYEKFGSVRAAFDQFVAAHQLQDVVKAVQGDLCYFADHASAGLKLRLAFIDGDHGREAVKRDIALVERYLLPGGWICFDDAFSSYTGVNEAIEERIIYSGQYVNCQQMTRKLFVAQRKG